MSRYRIAINLELTGKCNARCSMCPREAMVRPRSMTLPTLRQAVARFDPVDVFRVVVAGFGEPTTHPRFSACMEELRRSPVAVDMVTNGQLLDRERLQLIDGVVRTLVISFSSIDPHIYRRVHINLDQQRVMEHIVLARRILGVDRVAISLTPLANCIASLPQTIDWLREQGIEHLSMSPSLYDRGGALNGGDPQADLRAIIRRYGLHSQELDFVPSLKDLYSQWRHNKFKCLPRNVDLAIAADGSYQYCFNDIGRTRPMGMVGELSFREALELREQLPAADDLCRQCNMRGRYGIREIARALPDYWRQQRMRPKAGR